MREEVLADGVRLIQADCREVLPTLGRFDAVVTDPPYGIGESAKKSATRGKLTKPTDYGNDDWDRDPPDAYLMQMMRYKSDHQIIFGGNYFDLPPSSCWLVWDKKNGDNDFADCELAWTNLPKAVRRLEWMWNGMLRRGQEPRFHLTQKPLGVMEWCIGHLPRDAEKILDPFMGSGTTGVAAVKLGRKFTGIEIEPKYFDIACRRIADQLRRPDMFVEASRAPVQEVLL